MRYDGGFDAKDPAHGGRSAQAGSHTFVGSRASSVWAVFDTFGTSPSGMGTPNMKCAIVYGQLFSQEKVLFV
eukprot:COSAG02_NODE_969_length_15565_cov_9.614833_9_plen_72_part_00